MCLFPESDWPLDLQKEDISLKLFSLLSNKASLGRVQHHPLRQELILQGSLKEPLSTVQPPSSEIYL